MLSRIDSVLNIRPDERRNVYLLLAQYFFMGAAMLFAQTVSMPLFLEYWDASAIPFTYIGIAIVVSSITAVFLKISEHVSLARWLWATILFVSITTLILRAGLAIAPSKWLALFLPICATGLVLAAVYHRTGSLVPGIIAHALNNATAFAVLFLVGLTPEG